MKPLSFAELEAGAEEPRVRGAIESVKEFCTSGVLASFGATEAGHGSVRQKVFLANALEKFFEQPAPGMNFNSWARAIAEGALVNGNIFLRVLGVEGGPGALPSGLPLLPPRQCSVLVSGAGTYYGLNVLAPEATSPEILAPPHCVFFRYNPDGHAVYGTGLVEELLAREESGEMQSLDSFLTKHKKYLLAWFPWLLNEIVRVAFEIEGVQAGWRSLSRRDT